MQMDIKIRKPITSGTRHQICLNKGLLSRGNRLLKKLVYNVHRKVGRSSHYGQITVWGKGAGCKKLYRNVKFSSHSTLGINLFTTYDPNRTAFISLNFDLLSFSFYYTLALKNVISGSLQVCNKKIKNIFKGYRTSLINLAPGAIISNLAIINNNYGQYIRAAGTFGQLIHKNPTMCKVRLPSNLIISIPSSTFATLGCLDNTVNKFVVFGKAGKSRLRGIRPTVRGIAMNPVDHPHGGRTNGGRPSVTPWGIPTKGFKTRSKKKQLKNIL